MADEREEFIERIYAEYAPKLERMCLYYIHYQAECRDLVDESIQKTFLRAFEEYDKLKDCEYIEAWLYKTCRYRLMTELNTYRRRQKRHVAIDGNPIADAALATAVDALPKQIGDREFLEHILNALSEREKNVIQERYVDGTPIEEIAQKEKATNGAIRVLLTRLRKKVRRIAKDYEQAD